ncbi:MAG: tRNA lysidine(34) synthetase TilS [Patescibacteria group bacterium]|nr:tRNA lysidine(34) synthetase TilS [Patescibacteria group bacterium]
MEKISQKSIIFKVLRNIEKNKLISSGDTIIVALSGGPDSMCLFDVIFKLKDQLQIKISACHYNHRLRGEESYNDEEFVKKFCGEQGIECIFGSAEKENQFKNEEKAREARYAFFEKILGERRGAKIAIAHNLNDSAETFLMRLFRGTGMKGLSAIPSIREKFIRPLLPISRNEIETYLEHHRIPFRLDKTNNDLKITRNFLRLKILPLLSEHINPNILETLFNSARILEEDYDLLSQIAEKEYKKMIIFEGNKEIKLDRKKWISLHPSLQRMVIRIALLKIENLKNITNKQISEVCDMIKKGEGKKYKLLPYSLRIELLSGKIIIYR